VDPLKPAHEEFLRLVAGVARELGIRELPEIERTRHQGFGFFTARFHKYRVGQRQLEETVRRVQGSYEYLSGVSVSGLYLNADLNVRRVAELTLSAALRLGSRYGYTDECRAGSFLIEHTSANPVHPLHVGHGRNAALGDSLARLLRFCGNRVETHFYVNDCGAQVMYAALGYSALKAEIEERAKRQKPDAVIGLVYSAVNAIAGINKLKKELEREQDDERKREIIREIDEWVSVLRRLMDADRDLVGKLVETLGRRDVASEAAELNKRYEAGDPEVRKVVREVVELVLAGQRATLAKLGVEIDHWDYESEIAVWSGEASRVVSELCRRWPQYIERRDGAVVFRADRFVEDLGLREALDLPKFIPPVTLMRSDGTTLYVTRDVAYALWQARRGFDRVIRVISSEQTHEQAHVKILLHALGCAEETRKIVHYTYEMVSLPGVKMSARRGQYVTLDSIIEDASSRSAELARGRDSKIAEEAAEGVGVGSVRYAFLSASPRKPVEFRWEVVLDIRQNSGPFLQYTYVRARSILEKAAGIDGNIVIPDEMLQEEREILMKVAEWPSVVRRAAASLRPDYIAEFLNGLSLLFNSYYEKAPVLKAEEPVRSFRLALVYAVKSVLEAGFYILGIPAVARM
jgi:arginyl-tRNA synthetase